MAIQKHQENKNHPNDGAVRAFEPPPVGMMTIQDDNNEVEEGNFDSNYRTGVMAPAQVGALLHDDALPVAETVAPPPELLDKLRELEEAQERIPKAIPLDSVEERKKIRRQRYVVGAGVVIVTAIIAVVLGVLLGTRGSKPPPPAASTKLPPRSPEFKALQSLIESVSFDGGASLQDVSSPQYLALTWLSTNANLGEYEDWKKIQRYVMATFYFSTNGGTWTDNELWLSDDDECTWANDALDEICDSEGNILRLGYMENGLTGTLPLEIALLSDSLLYLGLLYNEIRGTIPTEYGLLTDLGSLMINDNLLTGSIPSELGRIVNPDFWSMGLYSNLLTGTIPTELFFIPGIGKSHRGGEESMLHLGLY